MADVRRQPGARYSVRRLPRSQSVLVRAAQEVDDGHLLVDRYAVLHLTESEGLDVSKHLWHWIRVSRLLSFGGRWQREPAEVGAPRGEWSILGRRVRRLNLYTGWSRGRW